MTRPHRFLLSSICTLPREAALFIAQVHGLGYSLVQREVKALGMKFGI